MNDKTTSIDDLKELVAVFSKEREWGKFHSAKNLAMSIGIEAAELMEIFQWVDTKDADTLAKDPAIKRRIEDEISDIVAYVMDMVNVVDFDLSKAFFRKMEENSKKYPVEKAKGSSEKYTEF